MNSSASRKRVLFICHQNRRRSLTAEQIYGGRRDLEVQSAGISEYARVPLTQDLLDWADQVFVCSKRQQQVLEERFGTALARTSVVCLNLPDRFDFNSRRLITKLIDKLWPYLGAPTISTVASSCRQAQARERVLRRYRSPLPFVRVWLTLFSLPVDIARIAYELLRAPQGIKSQSSA
jgi:predicted protein tyrosine phosphatase